ncbi:hypothetical protein CRUP_016188 [Coryphaenoides rupestris]|nr:hypothetical protein CRUP_016188 [Coryphaenoides rupestris]
MRSPPLVLLLLMGVQAVLNMGAVHHRSATGAAHHRTRRPHRPPASQSPGTASVSQSPLSPPDLSIPEVDPKVFSKRRFRSSPRVVFQRVPPVARRAGGKDSEGGWRGGGGGGGSRGSRAAAAGRGADDAPRGVLGLPVGRFGCRGIDGRYWNSYCTNTHTFVSAMTTFQEKTAWRNIRINVACVCVLTRKSWNGRAGR